MEVVAVPSGAREVVPGVEVDFDGLLASLRSKENYSLPLEVRPGRGGVDLAALAEAVESALGAAAERAQARVPHDPTGSTSADVALSSVLAEVNEGLMTEAEVTAWLTDFATALRGQQVRVMAPSASTKIPRDTLESWTKEPLLAPAAFLYFTSPEHRAPNGRRYRDRDPRTIDEIADYLADWVRLPSGVVTIGRGLSEFVPPPGQAAAQMRAVHAPQLAMTGFTLDPRRCVVAAFEFGGRATMSYFDETIKVTAALEHIVEALRTVGHLVEYAYVRMDRPVLPSDQVGEFNLGRPPTVAEALFGRRYNADEFAIGPSVAQILNPRHLAKGPALAGFACEELDNGRLLAVARDPAPWVTALNPPADVWDRYADDFAPITLTQPDFDRERKADRQRWGLAPR